MSATMEKGVWVRCTRHDPCPICGRPDWCTHADRPNDQGYVAHNCPRTPNEHPLASEHGEWCGYLHYIKHDGAIVRAAVNRNEPPPLSQKEMQRTAFYCVTRVDPVRLSTLSAGLGVTVEALRRLRIGWHDRLASWTFPMLTLPFGPYDVTGVRTRGAVTSEKRALPGSHNGLFIPTGLTGDGPFLIEEGPTSTAALLDLGYDAMGRPMSHGSLDLIALALRPYCGNRLIVVVANRDEAKYRPDGSAFWPGQEGGAKLAVHLARLGHYVKFILPLSGKDSRDWRRNGCSRALMDRTIQNANPTVAESEDSA